MLQYSATNLELKVNFTTPEFVSSRGGYDLLQVEFNSELLFVDLSG